jgi:hypothetical protein
MIPKIDAPELVESQADKEETVNEMGRRLVALAGKAEVVDRDLTSPPGSCADGDVYIVAGPSPTGAWSGHDGDLAVAVGTNASNGWYFITPREWMLAAILDEDVLVRFSNASSPGSWVTFTAPASPGSFDLADADDVDTAGVADGYILAWEDSPSGWRAVPRRLGAPWLFEVACSDETTALSAGASKVKFRQIGGVVVEEVRASLGAAQVGGQVVVDINASGASILSTVITIDAGATTSIGSSPQPVISDNIIYDNEEVSIDLDNIGGSPVTATGLKVQFVGRYLAA